MGGRVRRSELDDGTARSRSSARGSVTTIGVIGGRSSSPVTIMTLDLPRQLLANRPITIRERSSAVRRWVTRWRCESWQLAASEEFVAQHGADSRTRGASVAEQQDAVSTEQHEPLALGLGAVGSPMRRAASIATAGRGICFS
ncbi:hypothetical protein Pan216_01420 [Planctomycetes bacterium Pan216]|uniref:Uncharacterized protein n=1 Tax=Kolteria novifilia TaxID=2527975 RepID=A0A518AX74_9BACT|nr:hypothetical protein Pan216_01420 [Planctomycetes bacterium Pan216]